MATKSCQHTHQTFHSLRTHPRHTPPLTWCSLRHQMLPKCFILVSKAIVVVVVGTVRAHGMGLKCDFCKSSVDVNNVSMTTKLAVCVPLGAAYLPSKN